MKENLQKHVQVAFILLCLALVFVGGTWFVHHNQQVLEAQIRALLDSKQAYMLSLAEITDRNAADETTQEIVADCPKRNEYEALLGSLATLSPRELIVVQTLSESCSSFYVERKLLMVAKLERELEGYTDLLTLLETLTTHDIDVYHKKIWEEIVSGENARSTALRDQERIQTEIIAYLISGVSTQSPQVNELVRDAQEINELLKVYDQQLDEKRKSMIR
jgi:hypothetical protein